MQHSVYRIIDANFNRAREAARLIEEFCRFSLNCAALTGRACQIRHDLSALIAKLDDQHRLICARNSAEDIAAGRFVDDKLARMDFDDCLTAAFKRLPEALRVLAEMTHTINPEIAQKLERIRYLAYTLEKDIVVFSRPAEKFKKVRLYVLVSSNVPSEVIRLTSQCIRGGADCVQLRSKNINDDELLDLAGKFAELCRKAGAISIINDRADIAILSGADGVHLGQNDLTADQVRKLQLKPLIIGRSIHSCEQLRTACGSRPAYTALGPVFTSPTKPDVKPVGLDFVSSSVEQLKDTGITNVAIGGITKDNSKQVIAAGAGAVAVCSAVTNAPDTEKACRQLKAEIVKNFAAFERDAIDNVP